MAIARRRMQASVPDTAGEDGDFVQLRSVRERRLAETQKTNVPAEGFSEVSGVIKKENQDVFRDEPKSRPSTAARARQAEDLREKLFHAIDTDDKSMLQQMVEQITPKNPTDLVNLRDPKTNENILHYAMSQDKKDIVIYLISTQNTQLLTSHHSVMRSGIHGRNNALHIATEKHDTEMAKFILSKLPDKEKRLEMIKLETAVDIQGQRPRLFSCLHLAAYYGHTDLVDLYLDHGIDVNHPNGKNDTALLWAARWGHYATVNLLIDRKASPEVKNDKGSTALYWAIRYEFAKVVELLLTKGKANPNTKRKLGLVAPIIIAAAYGNVEIMSLLLKHPDIDIHVKIRGGEMAIHHAAREGCPSIVEMLVKRNALFDYQDELGDTPLLLAAKHGHYDIVQYLISKGADVEHRNHEGHDAWYFAIEDEEDNSLLQTLVRATRGRETTWRNPLCIAASNGRIDKIKFLLKLNIDPKNGDLDGNTFLHHAAMSNQTEVILTFHETISINTQNNKGNTPLHIACFRGYSETINVLIKCKAKADVKNEKGEGALHVAAYSKHITPNAVKELVEYTIKTHSWESLNAKDLEGNNCLHIAGKNAKPEVLWEFRLVRFKDRDKDGLLPLHEAVRPGQPEALEMMLDIFESMKRDARINEQSYATSETVLHLAAEVGHSHSVGRLINLGADIAVKDVEGDTVMHRLTKACVEDNHNIARHLEVFDVILENIVKWWCIKKNVPFPEEENQDIFMMFRRDAVLFAMNEIKNNEGVSVLDQAFKSGVPEILERLLMMKGVTMFEIDATNYSFDISGLTPRLNNELQSCCGNSVAPLRSIENVHDFKLQDLEEISGLEWLISHTEKVRAAQILDLPPIRMIERYYTSMVAWTFALLMFLHILYMSVLTYVGVDLLEKLREDESKINSSDPETLLLYIFTPTEPAIILIYVIYTLIRYCITGDFGRKSRLSQKRGASLIINVIGSYLFLAVCVIFAVLVFVWIGMFTERVKYQDYVLATAICIGWLLTISFTRGIRAIHYFYRMLLSMIFRDVLRFIIVYLFVILAFGFAFHVIFQISADVVADYPSPADTLFLAFNMMIGMGELFDGVYETNMRNVNRDVVYSKILYLIYIILGTIILLNLLIAMMNDSYSMILRENQVTWRIESVSLGVDIESHLPISRKFASVRFHQSDTGNENSSMPSNRWFVSISDSLFNEYMREIDRKYSKNADAVAKRLDELDHKMVEIERQTNEKLQNISDILTQLKESLSSRN
ncbi:hypothetical protein ACF0H5_012553 [Mactra antiquata]